MSYLTEVEFAQFGFEPVDNFDKLLAQASNAVDLYTNFFYKTVDFDIDNPIRRDAVKHAVAYQIAYYHESGVISADNRQALSSIRIGRTDITRKGSKIDSGADRFNLSLDALNWLKLAGFGYARVCYDR
ncbi:hypothetical protein [Eremococcus coleocola]|uniref:hypothetical protein n=1 Tax=Eremococcus coleocola TaxID=88132 RepID=UPI0003FAD867|nr:hypothetical protein [Eremococcus coleocola]